MTSCHYSPQQFEEHLLAQGGVLGGHGVLGAGPAHRGVGPGLEVLATTNVMWATVIDKGQYQGCGEEEYDAENGPEQGRVMVVRILKRKRK